MDVLLWLDGVATSTSSPLNLHNIASIRSLLIECTKYTGNKANFSIRPKGGF
jgi:hypothetical protein